jgi:DNA-binding NarL/FixJ family response regulator
MPSRTPVRAVVVDEWPMVRVGVGKVLGDCGVRVVADAADAAAALAALRSQGPGLLVVGRHDSPQAQLVGRALELLPALRCLALLGEPEDLRPVLVAGAHGAVPRGVDPVELTDVVRRILAGDRVVSPGLLPRLFGSNGSGPAPSPPGPDPRRDDTGAPVAALTGREREILRLLGAGRSNAEIASALFVSSATVKTHLAHIYGKLGARGRYEALGRAVALGLLD